MSMRDLFRPKWQHPDFLVRKEAVSKLSDQTVLAMIAKTDEEFLVRTAAVRNITDQAFLADVARTDESEWVRSAAISRLTDQAIIKEIAGTDRSEVVRSAAAEKIGPQALIAAERGEEIRKEATPEALDRIFSLVPGRRAAVDAPTRMFRVFVSSTFADLKAERDALVSRVYPRLRELCRLHGARFQAVDLRWGVSSEASLDQKTMLICLEELRRSQRISPRPNFVVLLGDRYGWRPLPSRIPGDEFAEIERHCPKRHLALLREWYPLDENAVIRRDAGRIFGEHVLRERSGEWEDEERWEGVERSLTAALREATAGMELSAEARLQYGASATEQEIAHGALTLPDAKEHVFCYFRRIANFDALCADAAVVVAARNYGDFDAAGRLDVEAQACGADLKRRLRGVLAHNVREHEARWEGGRVSTRHIDRLCEEVYADLERVILTEMARLAAATSYVREQDAHEIFGRERSANFVGREEILGAIGEYVTGRNRNPFVLFGPSGSGKSAVMARAARETAGAGGVLIQRFVGTTPQSSDGHSLLHSLCEQIAAAYDITEPIPEEYESLAKNFRQRLAVATMERPLVMFIDALDQLPENDPARQFSWLPTELPPNVRLVLSILSDEPPRIIVHRLPPAAFVHLKPMPAGEGGALLDRWLADADRTLREAQRREVLEPFEANGLPLYLKVAFEEARRWRSFTPREETLLGRDVPAVFSDLLARLESDHGPILVERSLALLAASRDGLSEDEILDLLSRDRDVIAEYRARSPRSPDLGEKPRLPVIVWSRLVHDFEPYFSECAAEGATVLSFYHRQLSAATCERYLTPDTKRLARHGDLASYFEDQPLILQRCEGVIFNRRKCREQPLQEVHARRWDTLAATLTDISFLEAKVGLGWIRDLLADCDLALEALPAGIRLRHIIYLLQKALMLDIGFLRRHPEALFQCLYNRFWWYDNPSAADHYDRPSPSDGGRPLPWEQGEYGLSELAEGWRRHKEGTGEAFTWLRALRPYGANLGSAVEAVYHTKEDPDRSSSTHSSVPPDPVTGMFVDFEEQLMVVGLQGGDLVVCDLLDMRITRRVGLQSRSRAIAVAGMPDRNAVIAAHKDGRLTKVDITDGTTRALYVFDREIVLVDFSTDISICAAYLADLRIAIIDLSAGKVIAEIRDTGGLEGLDATLFREFGLEPAQFEQRVIDKSQGDVYKHLPPKESVDRLARLMAEAGLEPRNYADTLVDGLLYLEDEEMVRRAFHKIESAFVSDRNSWGNTPPSGGWRRPPPRRSLGASVVAGPTSLFKEVPEPMRKFIFTQVLKDTFGKASPSEENRGSGLDRRHLLYLKKIKFATNGQTLITLSADNSLRLWDVHDGRERMSVDGGRVPGEVADFDTDIGDTVVVLRRESVERWDAKAVVMRSSLPLVGAGNRALERVLLDFDRILCWDSQTLVFLDGEGRLLFQRVYDQGVLSRDSQFRLGKSMTSTRFFTPVQDRVLRYDPNAEGIELTLRTHERLVNDLEVSFSPDGNSLVSVSDTGSIKIWDANDGRLRATVSIERKFQASLHRCMVFPKRHGTVIVGLSGFFPGIAHLAQEGDTAPLLIEVDLSDGRIVKKALSNFVGMHLVLSDDEVMLVVHEVGGAGRAHVYSYEDFRYLGSATEVPLNRESGADTNSAYAFEADEFGGSVLRVGGGIVVHYPAKLEMANSRQPIFASRSLDLVRLMSGPPSTPAADFH